MRDNAVNSPKRGGSYKDKARFHTLLRQLAETRADSQLVMLKSMYSKDAHWRGSHPLNEMRGVEAIFENVWKPLIRSFPDIERRDEIFVGGSFEGRGYIATMGYYCGTFQNDWFSIPSTGQPIFIRYGEVHEIKNGKIVQSNCIWDVLNVINQAGFWPLAPSLGVEERWFGPITADGLVFNKSDDHESEKNLAQTLAMQKVLFEHNQLEHFTRDGLLNMPQKKYWHQKMMWYGPSGIGTTRGLQGFIDGHQLPFRLAFPKRKGGSLLDDDIELREKFGAGHYIRIGDGKYSVTGGWPSVVSPHDGMFLGVPATGKFIKMRVMDFYHHDEGRIRENWVPIDILDILLQMGVDVLDWVLLQKH